SSATSSRGAGLAGHVARRSRSSTVPGPRCRTSRRRLWCTRRPASPGAARRGSSMAEPLGHPWMVNVLPGATATPLGIFLGYVRGGWWGGLLAGLCFAAPAFLVMLALTMAYAAVGVSPILRGALYGLGPVVL